MKNSKVFKALLGGVLIVLMVFALVVHTDAETCVPPPAGLVSWWPGDDHPNDIVSGNNGMLQNGAGYAAGKVGNAFSLDGENDFVKIDASITDVRKAYTLDAWVYLKAVKPGTYNIAILNKDRRASGGTVDLGFFVSNQGGIERRLGLCHIGGTCSVFSNGEVPLDSWTHVAVTWDGFGTVRFYINGALDKTVTGVLAGTNNAGGWQIGAGNGANAEEFFQGLIDEVEIFNRALSKTEIQAIFAAGSAGKCQSNTCTPPPANLVSWWSGDGNADDIQNGNDGTLQNGAIATAVGKVGQAFGFDGGDDYVDAGNGTNLNITGPITLDAWIKPTSVAGNQEFISKGDYLGGAGAFTYFFMVLDGKLRFGINIGGVGDFSDSTSTLSAGSWYHVAATFDPTSGTDEVKLYVNGKLDATGPITNDPPSLASDPLRIGALKNGAGTLNHFNGLVDEVEIYNRVLSAAEIAAIYNAGSAGKCKSATTACYTGNGSSSRSFTGLGFQPDVVIIKGDAKQNAVMRTSSMAGDASKPLVGKSALTSNLIKSLDTDGFTVGNDLRVNGADTPYCWVAFRAKEGELKVGSYVGNGTADHDITGVGFQPNWVVVMAANTTEAVHRSSTMPKTYFFNAEDGDSGNDRIKSLDPDGFSVGNSSRVNKSGATYYYAAWKAVGGKMAVGSYAGDGTDNRSIGGSAFRPEWAVVRGEGLRETVHKPATIGESDMTMFFRTDVNKTNKIQALEADGFQVGNDTITNQGGVTYHWMTFK